MQNDSDDEQWQELLGTEKFWVRVTLYKLVYAIIGLAIGIACIVAGVMLILNKLAGFTIETASIGELIATVPLIALFVIGLFIIIVTRYSKLSGAQEHDMIERDFAPKVSVTLRISQEAASKRFWKAVNNFTLIYSVCGLISGVGLIVGGVFLSLRLIKDSASWSNHIVDGILGMMLFGVGLFVIIVTRYSVRARNTNPNLPL